MKENSKKKKNLATIYRLYLQTLMNIRNYQNTYGDEDLLQILEEQLPEDVKINTSKKH